MNLISFEIVIDGNLHGLREWPAVPRVGEFIVARFDGSPENVEVEAVVWGRMDGSGDYRKDPTICAVHCKRK